jgi:hypothetical protein
MAPVVAVLSGYTPVFKSVFQGSLCGKWPDCGIWLAMLALQDSRGEIDAHPSYIATVTGCPIDDVVACIERFCEPDPSSRTPDEDGRRLVPIEGRGFGWKVVNHRKYREKARKATFDAARTEDGRNAERMAERTRADPRRPAQTRADPPSDTNTNTLRARKRAKTPTPYPENFLFDESLRTYVASKLPDADLDQFAESFKGKALARGWEYVNWRQAAQEYTRNCMPNSGHWAAGQYPKKSSGKWL